MKKIFTLTLLAAGLTFTASAQNDRHNSQDHYQVDRSYDNSSYGDRQQSKDYSYNDRRQSNDDYRRQADNDRLNQQYDKRNDGYGNDRSSNRYDRNRRMQEPRQETQQKGKAFGTGVVVGGIAVLLLGALLSHGN